MRDRVRMPSDPCARIWSHYHGAEKTRTTPRLPLGAVPSTSLGDGERSRTMSEVESAKAARRPASWSHTARRPKAMGRRPPLAKATGGRLAEGRRSALPRLQRNVPPVLQIHSGVHPDIRIPAQRRHHGVPAATALDTRNNRANIPMYAPTNPPAFLVLRIVPS